VPTSRNDIQEDIEDWNDWVIARPFGHPISINKAHAFQYGLYWGTALGLLVTVSWAISVILVSVTVAWSFGIFRFFTSTLLLLSDDPPDRTKTTIALGSIYHKPHYFLATFYLAFATTVLVIL
jgi:hypothetical protein